MPLPKILIFGQPFNRNSGGGITLSNLFQGWDKDKIAVICTAYLLENLDIDICNVYYVLGDQEHKWIFPFNKIQRSFESGLITFNNKSENKTTGKKSYLRQIIIDYAFFPTLNFFGIFHNISSLKLSAKLKQWLLDYKAEILYVQVSDRESILFAQNLHSFLNIPMIIHNMDDWPSTISTKGFFSGFWHKKIDREFRELLEHASLLLSISDDMAIEYQKRYGKKFTTFHNPINLEFWKLHQRNNYDLGDSPTILYAGRVGTGVATSLEIVARSVQAANLKLGLSIRFVLQIKEALPWLKKYDCVFHSPFIEYQDLPRKLSEADFLILPYDFSEKSIKFIKFSMPTKAPEYMISGTPILIFAPQATAIVKYAQRLKWAVVVTDNSLEQLTNAIVSLIQSKKTRELITENAKRVAEKNHSSTFINTQFKEIITSISNNKS